MIYWRNIIFLIHFNIAHEQNDSKSSLLKVNTLRSYIDLDLETLFCGSLDIIDCTEK